MNTEFLFRHCRTFVTALFTMLAFCVNAQVETCGNIPNTASALRYTHAHAHSRGAGNKLVKVYFHVYRDENGNGGQTPTRLFEIIEKLNTYFDGSGLRFFFQTCETRWVDSYLYHSDE